MNGAEITREDLRVFDLTEAELKVLIALFEKGPMSVSKLGRIASIPRTTTYDVLLRLRDRGFVRKLPRTYKSVWKVKAPRKIKDIVHGALEYVAPEKTLAEGIVGGVGAEEIDLYVYKGQNQIQEAYNKMLDLSRTERVSFIQGTRSAKIALERLGRQYLFGFHKHFKKAGIIMEYITGGGVLELFKCLSVEELASHKGRMIVSYLVPDEFMQFGLDIVVFRDTVLMIHWEQETVVFVRNKAIVEMWSRICAFLQANGRKFDLNAYVQKLIEEKEKSVV